MTALRKPLMTVDEFIVWSEAQEHGRYELQDGEIVVMQSERVEHTEVKFEAAIALRNAVARAGIGCVTMTDGATVRITDRTAFEPDALVYCGQRKARGSLEVPDPVIVAEVLSPGNHRRDLHDKLFGYFSVPSIYHYLIIDPGKNSVICHSRGVEGKLETRLLLKGTLRLDPPGIEIDIEAIFANGGRMAE